MDSQRTETDYGSGYETDSVKSFPGQEPDAGSTTEGFSDDSDEEYEVQPRLINKKAKTTLEASFHGGIGAVSAYLQIRLDTCSSAAQLGEFIQDLDKLEAVMEEIREKACRFCGIAQDNEMSQF